MQEAKLPCERTTTAVQAVNTMAQATVQETEIAIPSLQAHQESCLPERGRRGRAFMSNAEAGEANHQPESGLPENGQRGLVFPSNVETIRAITLGRAFPDTVCEVGPS